MNSLTSTQLCFFLSSGISDSQDNLLDFEYNIQGADLLDQSANLEGEPMEQDVVMLGEVKPEDPGHMLACGGRDLFEEDILPVSQLVAAVNAPTQEDLAVPARSPEVEAILQPLDIPCWAAMESDPCLPSMEE